jgi:outer membrane protein OmpA-like peptidoglycan-associated protein
MIIGVLALAIVAAAVAALLLNKKNGGPEPGSLGKPAPAKVSTPAPPARTTDEPEIPDTKVVKPEVPKQVNTDLQNDVNKRVRDDVLKRIDQMPRVSAENKDKLYNSVQRARGMGMILQIPFGSGKTALSAPEVQALVAALNDPQIVRLRDDPTAVFVVLGYADSKGDDAKNIAVSQSRADSVVAAMKNQAKVANVTHAVAMGGSTLHDAQSLAGNRVVEVWAVLP